MTTSYVEDSVNGEYYPSRMDYTGNATSTPAQLPTASVQFISSATQRLDVQMAYQAGAQTKLSKRIDNIQTYVGSALVKDYRVEYAPQTMKLQPLQVVQLNECSQGNQCVSPTQLGYKKDDSFTTAEVVAGHYNAPYVSSFGAPWALTPADVNGDGKTDMVAYYIGVNDGIRIIAFLSNGDGTYTTGPYNSPYTSSFGAPWALTPADVNGDGKTDMVAYYIGVNDGIRILAFLSNGDGTYTTGPYNSPYTSSFGAPWALTPADVNGDGKTDMVAYYIGVNDGIRILAFLSNGDGTYTTGPYNSPYTSSFGAPWALTPADVNGDGKTDMVAYYIGVNDGIRIIAFLSNGDGTYTTGPYNSPYTSSFGAPWALTPADVNGDGKTDMVAYYIGVNDGIRIIAFLSNGDGTYTTGPYNSPYTSSFGAPWALTPADVNGDGKTDMVAYYIRANDGIRILAFLSNGDGSYVTGVYNTPFTGSFAAPWALKQADVNGDGKTDMVAHYIGANDGIRLVPLFFKSGLQSLDSVHQNGIQNFSLSFGALSGSQNLSLSFGAVSSNSVPIYTKDTAPNRAVYPLIDIQSPMYVVSSVSKSNGVGGVNVTNYSYGGLKAELGTGRGMLGFRWMKSKEEVTGIESYTEYSQDFPYTGMAIKNETRLTGAGNAGVLKRSTSTPSCKIPMSGAACVIQTRCDQSANSAACTAAANARYYPYLESTQEESWDLSGAAYPVLNTATEYGLDTEGRFYGDPTKVTTSVVGGGSKSSVNEYYSADTANWVLGRLRRATVTSTTP